ncbi:MAG TPA: ABC transporter substrate-binding protein [Dongiaceae bacterium]|nr:ABC transporter substrate-binding protein [Dongiaceae bacterium]
MRVRRPALLLPLLALAVASVTSAVAAAESAGAPKPSRIVSLDLCADQLLVELVDRKRIAAVTHLAADPAVSAIPEKARGIPITHGAAEDVLRYDPDLVLAGPFGVSATVNLLRRLGRNVVAVPTQPQDLDGVRVFVRALAVAVGEEGAGEAMIADFDRRLARLTASATSASPPTALIYQIGGSVSGPGSLADAAIAAAGFRNASTAYRLSRGGQVPLEFLVARPPDLLVLSSAPEEYRTVLADNLRHPIIQLLRRRGASMELPWRYWLCGTPHIVDAIERLAGARVQIEARRP